MDAELLRLLTITFFAAVVAGVALGALSFAGVARWVQGRKAFDPFGLRATRGAGAVMIVAAMTAHSLPEGIAIAVVAALAVHNVPEAIAITLALRAKGLSIWQCVGWALVTSVPQTLAASCPTRWRRSIPRGPRPHSPQAPSA